MPSLQFRNSDTNIRERIGKGDVEFDRLASMLKEE